jgi:hypothetical protein
MRRRKGRPRARRVTKRSVAPRDPARYVAPAHDEDYRTSERLAPGVWMHASARCRAGQMVSFAVMLDLRMSGEWHRVVRIDSAHGDVHMHRYRRSGIQQREVFEAIEPRRATKVLERWFARAVMLVENEWRALTEGWFDGTG